MTERLDVEFPSGSQTCRGWLYRPDGPGPAPVLVMAHGLGAIKEMRLDAFAQRFADAGYAALVFDYRHFGDSTGEPRQLLDITLQRQDWSAAVDFARTLPGVDGSRIVLWGTSFSGGHVIATAAGRTDIAAVIAQCPFTDGLASVLAMNPVTLAKLVPRSLADLLAARRQRPRILVPLAGSPGSLGLMTAPDVLPGYLGLLPDGVPFRNEVTAGVGLMIAAAFPGRSARRVNSPILFCICDTDSVAPAKATARHARTAPRGELKHYPVGHFDIYVGDAFERAVTDQLDFLRRHVPLP